MSEQFDFFALNALRDRLAGMQRHHSDSLASYESNDGEGFCHLINNKAKASVACTSTCIASLVRTGLWDRNEVLDRTPAIAQFLLSRRSSSGLADNNPFSLAFMAEGVLDLIDGRLGEDGCNEHYQTIRDDHAVMLLDKLKSFDGDKLNVAGAIAIHPYPPSAYLTQLVYRVLVRLEVVEEDIRKLVHDWSRSEINKQVALIGAKSRTADSLQLAYALILAVLTASDEQTNPEDKEIFAHALGIFFDQQSEDGSWPLSRPMFHYEDFGNAYCFDYELLTQLLSCEPLRDELLRYLPHLERALNLAMRTGYDLELDRPGMRIGWASGHHPQLEGPESWSTASVYHFAHALNRVVAEGIRRALFLELGAVYPGPPVGPRNSPPENGIGDFAASFLDADLKLPDNSTGSLRETLARRFVFPIAREAGLVKRGLKLSKDTPMSAILFGPPGTSKTQLASIISEYLGWPLVSVDPSYLVQEGLDRVQAMANRLFSMLASVEEVVVLLDEFDEMGRNRAGNDNLLSRFITTAMLPKLAAINDERKIVFLLATNFVRGFDAAFSRGGRFDMRLQIMQPNVQAKLSYEKWKEPLSGALDKLAVEKVEEAKKQLDRLTFIETAELVKSLQTLTTAEKIESAFRDADEDGTLSQTNMDTTTNDLEGAEGAPPQKGQTWEMTCKRDANEIRLPALS